MVGFHNWEEFHVTPDWFRMGHGPSGAISAFFAINVYVSEM